MERRGFLGAMLAAAAAPAFVKAGTLMPLWVPDRKIWLWGDGIHDDGPAIAALINRDGYAFLPAGRYLIESPMELTHRYPRIHGAGPDKTELIMPKLGLREGAR